jgi:L-ascorbate metabolism protein UlaG (beta-lactamase superfamily)
MNKILVIILTLSYATLVSQVPCDITYVANEGFIIEVNNKKVVVDALFDKVDGTWCDSPSDSIVTLMRNAKPPFDNIDLIAITHRHVDHFDQGIVIDNLMNNQDTKVICPEQVKDILSKNPKFENVRDRIFSLTPEPLSDTSLIISDIKVRIIFLEHSQYMIFDTATEQMVNKHKDVENVGYIFDIDNVKMFHCGDTNPINDKEYSTYKLYKENIDIAFVERLFLKYYNENALDIIQEYIDPDYTIFMHINPVNKKYFYDEFENNEKVIVFKNKMQTLLFDL